MALAHLDCSRSNRRSAVLGSPAGMRKGQSHLGIEESILCRERSDGLDGWGAVTNWDATPRACRRKIPWNPKGPMQPSRTRAVVQSRRNRSGPPIPRPARRRLGHRNLTPRASQAQVGILSALRAILRRGAGVLLVLRVRFEAGPSRPGLLGSNLTARRRRTPGP